MSRIFAVNYHISVAVDAVCIGHVSRIVSGKLEAAALALRLPTTAANFKYNLFSSQIHQEQTTSGRAHETRMFNDNARKSVFIGTNKLQPLLIMQTLVRWSKVPKLEASRKYNL